MLGCQATPPVAVGRQPAATPVAAVPVPVPAPEPALEQVSTPADDLWQRIRTELSWDAAADPSVDRALAHYLDQPRFMPEVSQRASLYLYYIVEQVEQRDMPVEIALLPLVESELDPFAVSPGQAAGMWQIRPTTGDHLGLEQDWWYDGRRALRPSTEAALDYLDALHTEFDDDWLLALAAYNAGPGRVSRAIEANRRRGLPTDFWSLDLPPTTRMYIPKLLALSEIVSDPEDYGVEIPAVPNAPAFEVVEVGSPVELATAAQAADISLDLLRELNPGQLRRVTAPDQSAELLLPAGSAERFEATFARPAREATTCSPSPGVSIPTWTCCAGSTASTATASAPARPSSSRQAAPGSRPAPVPNWPAPPPITGSVPAIHCGVSPTGSRCRSRISPGGTRWIRMPCCVPARNSCCTWRRTDCSPLSSPAAPPPGR